MEAIPWKEESVRVTGAAYLESYFTVWFGDQLDNPYAATPGNPNPSPMGGIGSPNGSNSAAALFTKMPDPWSIVLKELKAGVEQLAGSKYNMVHLTYLFLLFLLCQRGCVLMGWRYQDGTDYVGGQEEDLAKASKTRHSIATLTLGIDSRVKFTHRTKAHKQDLPVASGSLMVLDGIFSSF